MASRRNNKMVTIKVKLADGRIEENVLSSRADYNEMLIDYDVQNLRNDSGQIIRYSGLVEGKTYEVGDSKKHHDGTKRFTFGCFVYCKSSLANN